MPTIELPNGWQPRSYQRPLWDYLERGGKRAIGIWHRRAGKDDVLLHRTAVAAFERPASYWHCLPEYAQARKAIWAAVNPHTGKRRVDEAFPHAVRESTNEQEMFIRFKSGSTWQLVGSDRYNSLVGAGIAGVTFSEWALCNPSAWGYMRPMVEENSGWAAFITTPRGNNHAKAMYDMAKARPNWFAEILSIHDTAALTAEQLEEGLAEYISMYGEDMGRAQFEQEYECSFTAAILGAFYAREMRAVRLEQRIMEIEALEGRPVHRAWDIGVRDDTSIWWFQVVGTQIFILDCYSASGVGVDHYAEVIEKRQQERGWVNGIDFVPHDAKVKEWGTGRTRVETMQQHGLRPNVIHLATKLDGINAVRRTLPRCVFHPRCEEEGIAALEMYRREWDDEKKTFKVNEVHDWSSHLADAFRYLALSWEEAREPVEEKPKHVMHTVNDIIAPPLEQSIRHGRYGR
jgi:phage terminase large subunit